MVTKTSLNVPPRNDMTITVAGGQVVITNAKGEAGGNLASKGGKKVRWSNETGGSCSLVFCELPNDESGTGGPLWPFVPEQVPPSNELAIPKDPDPGRNPWTGALFKKRATRYVKYDVIVTLPTGETVMLDPVIIIEK